MPIRGLAISAAHDHAIAVSHSRMAGRAINGVALTAAVQVFRSDRKREDRAVLPVDLAGVEIWILVAVRQVRWNRAFHRESLTASVGKEVGRAQWDVFGLVVHVLPAADDRKGCERQRERSECAQRINT